MRLCTVRSRIRHDILERSVEFRRGVSVKIELDYGLMNVLDIFEPGLNDGCLCEEMLLTVKNYYYC